MSNVIIATSVAIQAVTGALIEPEHLSKVTELPRMECRTGTLESKMERFLDEVMKREDLGKDDVRPAICVSMKGNPDEPINDRGGLKRTRSASLSEGLTSKARNVDGTHVPAGVAASVSEDTLPTVSKGRLLKDIISEKYRLPTFVLNRFQAFSFGAYHVFGERFATSIPIARSFACVNLANEVGCGLVLNGKSITRYDSNGSGGLQRIRRKSDHAEMRIVSIAGGSALQKAASSLHITVPELLDRGIRGTAEEETKVVDDVVDAVAQLILNSASHLGSEDIPHVTVNVYRNFRLPQDTKERFIRLLQREVDAKQGGRRFTFVSLFDSPLTDDDIKMIGVSRYAAEELKLFTPIRFVDHFMSDSVFAVTGLPASGKTTFLQSLYEILNRKSVKVGGILSREERGSKGGRIGFEMELCSSDHPSEMRELAVIKGREGRHKDDYEDFGRYSVNTYNVRNYVVPFIWNTVAASDFIIIDEVANMQLFSPAFRQTIEAVINGNKRLIISVPLNSKPGVLSTRIREEARKKDHLFVLDPKDKKESQARAMEKLLSSLGVSEKAKKEKAEKR